MLHFLLGLLKEFNIHKYNREQIKAQYIEVRIIAQNICNAVVDNEELLLGFFFLSCNNFPGDIN